MGIKAIIDKNMAKDQKILTTKEEIVTIDSKEMKEDHKETNEDHSRINTDKTDQLSQGKADRKLFTTKENSIRNSSKNNRWEILNWTVSLSQQEKFTKIKNYLKHGDKAKSHWGMRDLLKYRDPEVKSTPKKKLKGNSKHK